MSCECMIYREIPIVFTCCCCLSAEKAMSSHSSTLAWQIPWAEEPSRLQSIGSLGVGHNWATSFSLFIFMHWRRKWQPTPVFLPGESQGWGSLAGCHLSMGPHRVRHNWIDLAAAVCQRLGAVAKRSYPKPEARGDGQEDQPHIQGVVAVWAQEGLQELSHGEGQEGQWWGDTPHPR